MHFTAPLIPGTFVRRYKRFMADVVLESGEMITVHVANPGAMTGLDRPFAQVWLSGSEHPLPTLPMTWELVEADLGCGPELVGVNTARPSDLAAEAVGSGLIPELRNYRSVQREAKYGSTARVDFLLESPSRRSCYLKIKTVHLMRKPRLAEFPDSVIDRSAEELDELADALAGGARAVLLFVVQIASADRFAIARDIDPAYAAAFERARAQGVQILAWRCNVSLNGIEIAAPLPIVDG